MWWYAIVIVSSGEMSCEVMIFMNISVAIARNCCIYFGVDQFYVDF